MKLGANENAQEFKAQLEYGRSKGYILENASDCSWYISLGLMTVDELADSPGWVMRLYSIYEERMVCEARLVHYIEDKTILIGDIEAYIENKGYGSIMLSSVIKLAQSLNICKLKGNLSAVDSNHFDKLEYFYKKHGFHVRFDSKRISGEITRQLFRDMPHLSVQ